MTRTVVRDLRRAISWHRRKLAVLAAVAAVLTGVNAAAPPSPPSHSVVVAATRLPGGTKLIANDLSSVKLPRNAVPELAITDRAQLFGRTLTAPIAAGQVLTELSIVSGRAAIRPGNVLAPLRLVDADIIGLLSVGDTVDVIAADVQAGQATIIAERIRVAVIPVPEPRSGIGGVSGGGGNGRNGGGGLILVETDPKTATLLAQGAASAELSVVLR